MVKGAITIGGYSKVTIHPQSYPHLQQPLDRKLKEGEVEHGMGERMHNGPGIGMQIAPQQFLQFLHDQSPSRHEPLVVEMD
jgi:hypothetical protein